MTTFRQMKQQLYKAGIPYAGLSVLEITTTWQNLQEEKKNKMSEMLDITCVPCAPAPQKCKKLSFSQCAKMCIVDDVQENKQENNMDANVEYVKSQKNFLRDRAFEALRNKEENALKTYRLEDDPSPVTFSELKDRLEKGLYIWDKEGEEQYVKRGCAYNPFCFITWRDPSKPADQEGYNKFRDALKVKFNYLEEEIKIKSPEDGLKALRDFQAETIQ